jgi:hypothetical protein
MVEKERNETGVNRGGTPPQPHPPPTAEGKLSEIAVTISKIIENAVRVKRDALDLLEVPEAQLRRVVEELRRVTHQGAPRSQEDVTARILANTEEIKRKLSEQTKQGTQKTWSQVAQGLPARETTAQTNRQQNAEKRKDRELVVTILDESQKQIANRKSTQQVLEDIKAGEPKMATAEAIAIRKLASGDYQVTLTSNEARKTLEQTTGWLRGVAESAKVRPATFTVRAHGVRVEALDAGN